MVGWLMLAPHEVDDYTTAGGVLKVYSTDSLTPFVGRTQQTGYKVYGPKGAFFNWELIDRFVSFYNLLFFNIHVINFNL